MIGNKSSTLGLFCRIKTSGDKEPEARSIIVRGHGHLVFILQ